MRNKQLDTYCELHWWNMGTKTLSYKGDLGGLMKDQGVVCKKYKTDREGIFTYYLSNNQGIKFKRTGTKEDFPHLVKQFIQMELVRMGDPSQLYVQGTWRPTVTVNR